MNHQRCLTSSGMRSSGRLTSSTLQFFQRGCKHQPRGGKLEKRNIWSIALTTPEIKNRGFPHMVQIARAWMRQSLFSHVCRLRLGCERYCRTWELEVFGTSRACSVSGSPRSGNAGKQIPHRPGHMQGRYPDTGEVYWDFTIPPSAPKSVDRGMLYIFAYELRFATGVLCAEGGHKLAWRQESAGTR